jgi:sarcosine oxidase delta subunit
LALALPTAQTTGDGKFQTPASPSEAGHEVFEALMLLRTNSQGRITIIKAAFHVRGAIATGMIDICQSMLTANIEYLCRIAGSCTTGRALEFTRTVPPPQLLGINIDACMGSWEFPSGCGDPSLWIMADVNTQQIREKAAVLANNTAV